MPKKANARLTRLKRLLERQGGENKFGADYQPANTFTASEQPGDSRPSSVVVEKVPGRELIAQSKIERPPLLLALYHPGVFEVNELRMLSPVPRVHPLVGHPFADGWQFPNLRGTLSVADRLGLLGRHPKLWWPEEQGGPGEWVPVPFIGDHLIFLIGTNRPYCVNWTIKKDEADFKSRAIRSGPTPKQRSPEPKEIQRHEIEEFYYTDAWIPTYRVTSGTIDKAVAINLEDLVTWQRRELLRPVDLMVENEVIGLAKALVQERWQMNQIINHIAGSYSLPAYDVKIIVKRAMWNRKIRVDLFRRLRDDEPVWPETRDVLVEYAHLFESQRT